LQSLEGIIPPDAAPVMILGHSAPLAGIVWSRLGFLVISVPTRNEILRVDPGSTASTSLVRASSGGVQGINFTRQARLIMCETMARRVTRTDHEGSITVVADEFGGRNLNGPRHVVEAIDGSTYFTDAAAPGHRADQGDAPAGIYQVNRAGNLRLVADDLESPVGVTLSASHLELFASGMGGEIREFEINADGGLGHGRRLASMASDGGEVGGLVADLDGRLYCGGPDGVWIFNRDGAHLGTIATSEPVTGVAWGDDYRSLYIASGNSLHRMPLLTSGVRTF
jgi:gluconolactonase